MESRGIVWVGYVVRMDEMSEKPEGETTSVTWT